MFKAIKIVILSLEEIDINIDTDNLWQKCDFTLLHYYSYVFYWKSYVWHGNTTEDED